ncbi:hypothetical protein G9A89_016978 [Geosiphon pyriformis]|nr:hypothetical protein G9A89_016978 [Geosiphon pyriformis]
MPSHIELKELKEKYAKAGQEHVFTFYNELSPEEQTPLFNQLATLDVDRVNRIFSKAISGLDSSEKTNLEPLPKDVFESLLDADKEKIKKWGSLGLELIAQNKVAVILMAGGQGTRLQKVAQEAAKTTDEVTLPWYIMTSGPTRPATEAFFKKHRFFGLKEENVIFFEQGTLPALTNQGKLFLETKSKLAIAPDGNGGIYAALRNEGVLNSLKTRKIQYVHAYCVDNCLVRVADPVFIGYCVSKNAECGAKVVRKTSPDEPVGVIAIRNGKYSVVEYSEIDSEIAATTTSDGQLAYRAANIANHFYTVDFLNRVESFDDQLEYHIARKKIKHIEIATGKLLSPSKPNVFEVDRREEFSPLKNAPGTGVDDPDTSRRDIIAQHIRFVERTGGKVIRGDNDESSPNDQLTFEISPLVSYAGEGLDVLKDKTIRTPTIIETATDLEKLTI